jgi:phage terminase large subunit
LIKCVFVDGPDPALYCDQLIYQKGLHNSDIAKLMAQEGVKKGYDEIFADSASPQSISELYDYGYNIKTADKDIMAGVQRVNQYKQYWTQRSVESIKEQRSYMYIEDKMGKRTNKPADLFNHSMDARRYGVMGKLGTNTEVIGKRIF